MMHHVSIRTANIHRSLAFYEKLGFTVKERFTTGYTLACWMEGLGGRVELIQIPEPKPAPEMWSDEHYVGYYHISFDLSEITTDLPAWLNTFKADFDHDLQVLLEPTQQMIGDHVYEVAFIADPDGLPLELLRLMQ